MNTSKEVMLEFNKKFQIRHMLGEEIKKSELIAFAMKLDTFYSDSQVVERYLTSAPSDIRVDFTR